MKRSPSFLVLILVCLLIAIGIFVGRSTHQAPALAEAAGQFEIASLAAAETVTDVQSASQDAATVKTRTYGGSAARAARTTADATVSISGEETQDWVHMPGTRIGIWPKPQEPTADSNADSKTAP
jgi:hypothetical protein